MKLALIGYGKMGKTIDKIATDNGDEVVFKIDKENTEDLHKINSSNTDVVIEFSNPESAFNNLAYCIKNQIPVVSGTTGWLDRYQEVTELCLQENSAMMYASNFSIGVNIFFELNKFLAEKMKNYKDYKILMEEIHHTEKLDAPSGTAITLAEGIIERNSLFDKWQDLHIESKRIGKTPGTHMVTYSSEIDDIEIKHTAHGRVGFAQGAYEAAKWIKNKKGVFSIQDMLFG
jgi:4-hydroxy-tetrahydrodipicolinate reductase